MTAAQATIRRLYEQVRVLEAEAARPPRPRTRLPYVCVLVAAVGIGAVSAGVSHTRHAAPAHRLVARIAPPVAHLIDAPAERARALPAPSPHHRSAHRRGAPARIHIVSTRHNVPAAPVVHTTPAPAQAAVAPAPAPSVHVAPGPAPAVHAAPAPAPAPVPAPAKAAKPAKTVKPSKPSKPAPAPAAKPAPQPVGIGSVVVSTSDEPLPDDAGATTSTTPTP